MCRVNEEMYDYFNEKCAMNPDINRRRYNSHNVNNDNDDENENENRGNENDDRYLREASVESNALFNRMGQYFRTLSEGHAIEMGKERGELNEGMSEEQQRLHDLFNTDDNQFEIMDPDVMQEMNRYRKDVEELQEFEKMKMQQTSHLGIAQVCHRSCVCRFFFVGVLTFTYIHSHTHIYIYTHTYAHTTKMTEVSSFCMMGCFFVCSFDFNLCVWLN